MLNRTPLPGAALALALTLCLACDGGPSPSSDAAASLQYYATCGDPVCGGHRDLGLPACTTERAGQPCSTDGTRCDPGNDCNALLLCASKDPKGTPEMCPISRRAAKDDIRYLDDAERARLHDELKEVRLATYRYRHDGPAGRRRLGFLIDDSPGSLGVDPERGMVDLYGYTSLAVAALQVQARQIEALRQEVTLLRQQLEKTRRPRR